MIVVDSRFREEDTRLRRFFADLTKDGTPVLAARPDRRGPLPRPEPLLDRPPVRRPRGRDHRRGRARQGQARGYLKTLLPRFARHPMTASSRASGSSGSRSGCRDPALAGERLPGRARPVRRDPRDRKRHLPRPRLAPGRLRTPVAEAPRGVPARCPRAARREGDLARGARRARGGSGRTAVDSAALSRSRRRRPSARHRRDRLRARARRRADPALGVPERERGPRVRPDRPPEPAPVTRG